MTIFRAGVLAKLPRGIRVLATLILTAAPLADSIGPSRAAEGDTPPTEIFQLQKDLVEALNVQWAKMQEENRVGQRTEQEIIAAMEDYYSELGTACVMEAMVASKNTAKTAQILPVRIEIVSAALETFGQHAKFLKQRSELGEITGADVASAKAAALKAEIRLGTLKKQLPPNAGKPARPCEIAGQPEPRRAAGDRQAAGVISPRGAPPAPSPRNR